MRSTFACIICAICFALGANAQTTEADSAACGYKYPQSIGLVLSGGGAKGIAHIGVLQALEENNIPIDYITGTSMGAIVGGLYASGYTPKEMLDIILSKPFSYWSTGQIDPSLTFYFATEEPSPVMLNIPITTKRDSLEQVKQAVPASLISPMPMNFALIDLFAGQTAQSGGDFNKLFVPYRCVASDVAAKHKVVLSHGDLGYSIRSSMSFPIVFQPTSIDSMLLYDGGIYDNFPADVMKKEFAPDFVIGVDVSSKAVGPQTSLMDQIEDLVVQHSDYYLDPANGIKIDFNLNEFTLLDFPKANAIYKIGYDKTISMIDSIKSRIHSRIPKEERELRRAVFKSQTPYLRFDSVEVYGASPRQNAYLEYLFHNHKSDTFGIDKARSAYYRAISPGKLRDFVPHAYYNDSTGLFSLKLKASVKNNLKLGIGGYITSGTSSYVYVSAGYSTLSFSSVSAKIGAWLGQSYLGGMLTSRIFLRTPLPSALEFQGVMFRQKFYDDNYLFFETKSPSYILDHEYFARLKWAWAVGSLTDMEVGVGYGHLNNSYYQTHDNTPSELVSERDECRFNLAQAYYAVESNTLDDINFPTMGHYFKGTAMAVTGGYNHYSASVPDPQRHARPKWLQLELRNRNYFTLGRHFSFGVEADIILSTRKLLRDYNATMVTAPAFLPTPSSYNTYNPAFRSNSFIALGLAPIYRYNDNLSARIQGYVFMPLRKIIIGEDGYAAYEHNWLSHPVFLSELDICYKLPFATVTAYCNYASKATSKWNVGISFGVFLPAPRFLR